MKTIYCAFCFTAPKDKTFVSAALEAQRSLVVNSTPHVEVVPL